MGKNERDILQNTSGTAGKPLPPPVRVVLTVVGVMAVILGFVGIFLPLVPTVPFLLLAAACFARSSERLHRLLLDHRRFGPIIRDYTAGAGLPPRAKGAAIATIWLTIPPSALFIVPDLLVKFILFGIAIAITIYLVTLPTKRQEAPVDSEQANQ